MGFSNASRGLHIEGTNFQYLSEGGYAAAFVDQHSGKVRKIYFKREGEGENASAASFEAETDAYESASNVDELRALIPAYFGTLKGAVICDQEGKDVSIEFCTDRIIEMEFVPGEFRKINTVLHSEEVKALFQKHGIFGISDASVTLVDSKICKVIDFGTHEIERWHD